MLASVNTPPTDAAATPQKSHVLCRPQILRRRICSSSENSLRLTYGARARHVLRSNLSYVSS
eukprot:3679096-Prorocentrum_lima.AAC.1